MNVQESTIFCSDPKTAIAIPEQTEGKKSTSHAGHGIRFNFFLTHPVDFAFPSEKDRAVNIFRQTEDAVKFAWQRIELWRTGLPSPQPILYSGPKITPAVFEQTDDSWSKAAILSVALDGALLYFAEPTGRNAVGASPDHALAVLKESKNDQLRQLMVKGELAILPTCKPFRSANPECAVPRGEQGANVARGKILTMRWLPGQRPVSIEEHQTEL